MLAGRQAGVQARGVGANASFPLAASSGGPGSNLSQFQPQFQPGPPAPTSRAGFTDKAAWAGLASGAHSASRADGARLASGAGGACMPALQAAPGNS